MARFAYWQMDVFAARRGGGNPLGVVLDARGWSAEAMQAFARWTNLVETTFVLPADDAEADYQVRMFTPRREIPFAAHPSLGTAQALLDAGRLAPRPLIRQRCGIGDIPIRCERRDQADWLFLRSPAGQPATASEGQRRLAERLLQDRLRSPAHLACMQGGRRWWVAEFCSEQALREWQAPIEAIAELAAASDTLGICGFARTGGEPALAVRAFPAGVGIDEDPASGAANGLIASWLLHSEAGSALSRGYRVSQGREIGHDALIEVSIEASGDVWVGGLSNTIVRGEAEWEIDA